MIECFYFGNNDKLLFGSYHSPRSSIQSETGIVICNPMGHEYIRAHRTLFQLANQLSSVGYHVLRFDFFGTGDSLGCFQDASFKQWKEDIVSAIDELKYGCEVKRVCLIGLRLGATLNSHIASLCTEIDGVIFWEPIYSGNQYVAQLESLHRRWLQKSFAKPTNCKGNICEILGFPLMENLRGELEQANFNLGGLMKNINALFLYSDHDKIPDNVAKEIKDKSNIKIMNTEGLELWSYRQDAKQKSYVPLNTIRQILSWLEAHI